MIIVPSVELTGLPAKQRPAASSRQIEGRSVVPMDCRTMDQLYGLIVDVGVEQGQRVGDGIWRFGV